MLLVHGFDVSLSNSNDLRELVERTGPIRALTGVQLRILRTNSKDLRLQKWEDHLCQLAACIPHVCRRILIALMGSSNRQDALVLPWGSNPVTDHLLSGGELTIVHDGAAFSRTDKIAFLTGFPAALQSLKVCWEGKQQGRNCGVCEKCVRTQLNFLAVGMTDPSGVLTNHSICDAFRTFQSVTMRCSQSFGPLLNMRTVGTSMRNGFGCCASGP